MAGKAAIASVARGQELTVPVSARNGERYFCTYVPVEAPAEQVGAIELAEPLSMLSSFARRIAAQNLVLGLALGTAGGASLISLGILLIGRPLNRLSEKARQIGEGDLTPSLDSRGRDELAELARSMNDMCRHLVESQEKLRLEQERRIAAIEQLRQADRLRTVGQLAAGVAHELGTPLNTISIRAGMLAAGRLANGDVVENGQIIKSQARRMTAIIRELLVYARPRRPKRSLADLAQVARETINLLTPLVSKYDAAVALRESESGHPLGGMAMVDADQIQQVLTNLLVNSLQAISAGGRVEVDVRRVDAAPPGASNTLKPHICVSIQDNGKGIAAENLKHIFDPFFTTKDVGEGTGLGLSIAYGIVQEHGGWIDVSSEPGEGSCFCVYLRAADKEVETRSDFA